MLFVIIPLLSRMETSQELQTRTEPSTERIIDPQILKKIAAEHKKLNGKVILEIGFGGKFSVNLGENDLSIGVDPGEVTIDDQKLKSGEGAKRVFFHEKTDVIPE